MKKLLLCCSIIIFTLYGCKDDDLSTTNRPDEGSQITINIQNLPALSDSARYEAWFFGESKPVARIGVLTPVSGSVNTVFNIKLVDLKNAKYVIITIEPQVEDSAGAVNPSSSHILAGPIEVNNASVDVKSDFALRSDFADITGKYALLTLSDPSNTNQKSGVWFVELSNATPAVGLNLPSLPAGWTYEGWITKNGQTLSTGQFTEVDDVDSTHYSGTTKPKFPGEDFLNNPPAGLTFPLDLSGASLFITIEPTAERKDSNPFGIKLLQAEIPANAAASTSYDMQKSAVFPTGSMIMKVKI